MVDISVFAKFDQIPSLPVQDIEKSRGWTYGWTDNMKTVYPPALPLPSPHPMQTV